MRHSFLLIVFLLITSLSSLAMAQGNAPDPSDFTEGNEYFEISSPVYETEDGRVEILSFYWYNCGGCFYLEPKLAAWAAKLPPEKVRFIRLPFGYSGPSIFHAKVAFALEEMKLGQEAHLKMFELLQEHRLPIYSAEQLPQLAAALNVDANELTAAFNSPMVSGKIAKLSSYITKADVTGVPAMVIDGKYRFDIGTTHGAEGFLGLADILVDRQLDERD